MTDSLAVKAVAACSAAVWAEGDNSDSLAGKQVTVVTSLLAKWRMDLRLRINLLHRVDSTQPGRLCHTRVVSETVRLLG